MNSKNTKRGRPSTGKAKSNSELQKAYRERRKRLAPAFIDDRGQGSTQLNIWLPMSISNALNRLSKHQEMSKAELISRLLVDEQKRITNGFNDKEIEDYFKAR